MKSPYSADELDTGDRVKNAVTHRGRDPHKIGVCLEFAGGTRVASDFYDAIQLAFDEAIEREELDRPVELVVREVNGPMKGAEPRRLRKPGVNWPTKRIAWPSSVLS